VTRDAWQWLFAQSVHRTLTGLNIQAVLQWSEAQLAVSAKHSTQAFDSEGMFSLRHAMFFAWSAQFFVLHVRICPMNS
jgi:hypothetical protein